MEMFVVSHDKTSDSGVVNSIITQTIRFSFENTDSTSGYINIRITAGENWRIGGYYPLIFLIILISVVIFVSIKKKYSIRN
jgi:hypothetical protein